MQPPVDIVWQYNEPDGIDDGIPVDVETVPRCTAEAREDYDDMKRKGIESVAGV